MTDSSIMPWGKHKGEKLANIPAAYLIWLYGSAGIASQPHNKQLADYIKSNMDALKTEAKRSAASQRR
jgi:hypothetical protein